MSTIPPVDPGAVAKPPARPLSGTLDLLMEMEMPVVVRFGSTSMPVRDVLDLGPGAMVEFRRSPEEPVEILVNGRVVARGTVVVVQGNYGVRIIEIASQRDTVTAGSVSARCEIRGNE